MSFMAPILLPGASLYADGYAEQAGLTERSQFWIVECTQDLARKRVLQLKDEIREFLLDSIDPDGSRHRTESKLLIAYLSDPLVITKSDGVCLIEFITANIIKDLAVAIAARLSGLSVVKEVRRQPLTPELEKEKFPLNRKGLLTEAPPPAPVVHTDTQITLEDREKNSWLPDFKPTRSSTPILDNLEIQVHGDFFLHVFRTAELVLSCQAYTVQAGRVCARVKECLVPFLDHVNEDYNETPYLVEPHVYQTPRAVCTVRFTMAVVSLELSKMIAGQVAKIDQVERVSMQQERVEHYDPIYGR